MAKTKTGKTVDPNEARLDALYATLGTARAKRVESESRICFGISWFTTEADADAYADLVRACGVTYNGGWFDGMLCGRAKEFDGYWKTKHPDVTLFAVTD